MASTPPFLYVPQTLNGVAQKLLVGISKELGDEGHWGKDEGMKTIICGCLENGEI